MVFHENLGWVYVEHVSLSPLSIFPFYVWTVRFNGGNPLMECMKGGKPFQKADWQGLHTTLFSTATDEHVMFVMRAG